MLRINSCVKSIKKQHGLSLVELMVALVLSLVVMFVTTSMYVSNKQTYRFLDQYSLLQENGRFAIFFLRENILQAGFPREAMDPFPTAPANDREVTVQFRSARDCLNNTIPTTPPTTENTFRINNENQLTCTAQGVTEELVDGIEDMRVLYGLDTSGDGIANTYATSAEVVTGIAGASWPEVVSVRVAILAAGQPNSLDVAQTITYNLLGQAVTTADRTPRRVFTSTIPLRNRNKTIAGS